MPEDKVVTFENLATENAKLQQAIRHIRAVCEADGVNPTIERIRRFIDNAS